jgi:hypothetical protein
MKDQKNTHASASSPNCLCQAALTYFEKFGFSVAPIKLDKKPYIKWEEFQTHRATRKEIIEWWNRWPNAMIGIVTGAISKVVVIDVDTSEGREAIEKYIPDSLTAPTCQTPTGGLHLYFCHPGKQISNNIRTVPGCDFRGDGGYVIAPPSVNREGKSYAWLNGLSIDEVELPPLPNAYLSFIKSSAFKGYVGEKNESHAESRIVTGSQKILTLGRRDNDLFHVANCLVKGRTQINEIEQYLGILAKSCNPPFPLNEMEDKIKSALKRVQKREINIAKDLRRWIEVTDGHFEVTDYYKESRIVTPEEKHAAIVALKRMADEGIIEKYGSKRGVYRRIESECEEIDFLNAPTEALNIRWTFGIERYVKILPKNIIVVAGSPDSGKTAFLLNTVRLNMDRYKIHYFSSEMGDIELRDRLSKFDFPLSRWKFTPKERSSNFADVIHPDEINIVDYLEVHDEFYKVGGLIKEIYDKLKNGVAIIALQKNPDKEYGLGGARGLEKARLYLSMGSGKIKMVKAKNWVIGQTNPNGLELNFKLVQGWNFLPEGDWHK